MITVDVQAERFFIALCKQEEHTFLMLGTYYEHRVTRLLCRVGKFFNRDGEPDHWSTSPKLLIRAFFSSARAHLQNEGLYRDRKASTPISYQAFDISFSNYCEFVRFLESIQTEKNRFYCFKPLSKSAEDPNKMDMDVTDDPYFAPLAKPELAYEVSHINLSHTCRHTGMKLIEEVTKNSISNMSSTISSYFFVDLPNTTRLDYGLPSNDIPFYVLPPPPASYPGLNAEQFKIVAKLYRRMESLLDLDPHSEQTQDKFNSLKNLYREMVNMQPDVPLEDLLKGLQEWKQANAKNLGTLRETFFWDSFFTRRSATLKMFDEIELSLNNAINHGQIK